MAGQGERRTGDRGGRRRCEAGAVATVRQRQRRVAGAAAAASAGGERGPAEVGDDPTVGPTWQSRRGPA